MKTIGILLLAVSVSGGVFAQIGLNPEKCGKIWGSPENGPLDADGHGVLKYYSRGTDVVLTFEQGLVLQAFYRKADINERDINSLLQLNKNQAEWMPWSPPGIPPEDVVGTTWFRSDEAAMARLDGEQLRIVGSRYGSDPAPRAVKPSIQKAPLKASEPKATSTPEKKKAVVRREVPRSSVPQTLPVVGDSRQQVINLLGEPSGVVEASGKEVLVYGWGNIWITEDKVISVN